MKVHSKRAPGSPSSPNQKQIRISSTSKSTPSLTESTSIISTQASPPPKVSTSVQIPNYLEDSPTTTVQVFGDKEPKRERVKRSKSASSAPKSLVASSPPRLQKRSKPKKDDLDKEELIDLEAN